MSSKSILYDQHFCTDDTILTAICRSAELRKGDVVLEIGPGTGNLTRAMAPLVKKIIAIEIDASLSLQAPKNVEMIYGNALQLLPRQKFTKLIANIPYQICEPLLQLLCMKRNLGMAVLLVPKKFATHISQHPIFSAFFDFELIQDVPREAFSPPPKVTSAILKIIPTRKQDDNIFLRQKLHLQRDKQVKNAVRDTLIDLFQMREKILTKKQALNLIDNLHLPQKTIAKLTLQEFQHLAITLQKLAPR